MDDELLGYLQGAMQPAEREAFERRLAVDDELRRRCELIRESLREIVAAVREGYSNIYVSGSETLFRTPVRKTGS